MGKGLVSLQRVYRSAQSLTSVLPPQGRGSGFPGRRRPRGAGLSGRAGRGRARSKNGVNPNINPGVRTAERRLYSLHIVNGFCIFIPDWVKKASNFSKSQIFSAFFFLVFWRCADHHNRDTIPSQGRGGQRHAQHSGHFFQQWQFHIKTGAVLLYSYLENTRLRWWDFMSYYLLRICVSISLLKQCSERIAALWKTPKTEYNNNIPISQDLLFVSLCFVFNITNHYFK